MGENTNSDNKRIWVTGADGFVGSVMMSGLDQAGYEMIGTSSELSVTEPERLEAFAEEVQPGIIINCAGVRRDATTLSNKAHAYEVNALGARNVALAANTIGALIVQVSSDDVYGQHQDEPVNEFDMPHPNTAYGKSKRAGEFFVRSTTDNHLILRSSWVYQADSGRFKRLMDAARSGGTYESRIDQFAAPASIALYMKYLNKMIERGARGTYHITPKGKTSRYDFASEILKNAGFDPEKVLLPVSDPETAEDIVLESLMLEMAGADLPTWEEDLHAYMSAKGLIK